MSKRSFWAARPFGYGPENPMLDVGQVIEIEVGQKPNDERLIRLGHLREVRKDERPVSCGPCGKRFVNERYRNQHAQNNHNISMAELGRSEAPFTDLSTAEALGRLKALEAADKYAEEHIPLNLDKTRANQESGRRRASR